MQLDERNNEKGSKNFRNEDVDVSFSVFCNGLLLAISKDGWEE